MLWASSIGAGLFTFDEEKQRFDNVDFLDKPIAKSNKNNYLTADKRGNLLLATWNGLYLYHLQTKIHQHYKLFCDKANPAKANFVTKVLPLTETEVLVGTLDGLYRVNTETGQSKVYLHYDGDKYSLSNNTIETLVMSDSGEIWVGTHNGLNIFDLTTKHFHHIVPVENNPPSINDYTIRSLFIDGFNNLWVGLNSYGVDRLSLGSRQFGLHYKTPASGEACIANDTHFNILRSSTGHLWLESYRQGLHKIGSSADDCRWFREGASEANKTTDHISPGSLFEDSRGDIWFGTIGGPVYRLMGGDNITTYQPSGDEPGAIRPACTVKPAYGASLEVKGAYVNSLQQRKTKILWLVVNLIKKNRRYFLFSKTSIIYRFQPSSFGLRLARDF